MSDAYRHPFGAQVVGSIMCYSDRNGADKQYEGMVVLHEGRLLGICAWGRRGATPRHTVYGSGDTGRLLMTRAIVQDKVAQKLRRGYRIIEENHWDYDAMRTRLAQLLGQADATTAIPAPPTNTAAPAAQTPAAVSPDRLPARWWEGVRDGASWPEVFRLANDPRTIVLGTGDATGDVLVAGDWAVHVDRRANAECECSCGTPGCAHLLAATMLISGALHGQATPIG